MATRKPSPAMNRMQAFKDTVDYGIRNKSGLKQTSVETAETKSSEKPEELTKSTSTDPSNLQEYTTLTNKLGEVKDVSTMYQGSGGRQGMVHLTEAQQKSLQRNIETGVKNDSIKNAYSSASEKGKAAMKEEGVKVSPYEKIIR